MDATQGTGRSADVESMELKNAKQYEQALAHYKLVEMQNFDCKVLKEACEAEWKRFEIAQSASMQDIIRNAPTGSPAAFLNRFKGRELTDDDLKEMALKVKEAVKPRDLQKKWLNPREYQKALGDRAELFVDLLKQ